MQRRGIVLAVAKLAVATVHGATVKLPHGHALGVAPMAAVDAPRHPLVRGKTGFGMPKRADGARGTFALPPWHVFPRTFCLVLGGVRVFLLCL